MIASGTHRKEELHAALEEARRKTLWLLDQVPDEYLRVRVHSFYSPIGWHFGHVGRTEEFWVCHKALGQPVLDDHLSFMFADLPENPKDNRVNIPSREEIVEYLHRTRENALRALDSATLDSSNPFLREGYAWDFALQHECQHQETICEMLQLIQKHELTGGTRDKGQGSTVAHISMCDGPQSSPQTQWIDIPGGTFTMGTDEVCVYDNEQRAHEVRVDPFRLAKDLVTAAQWQEFINDGGYSRSELWSAEGWAWCCIEDAKAPEYWIDTDSGYRYLGPFGLRDIDPDEPAGSLSWYEAEAFLNWSGCRFPTEEEWEFAASFAPDQTVKKRYPWGDETPNGKTAVFGMSGWGQQTVGQKSCGNGPFGNRDLAGNLWEWTSSKFLPYPGFEAFPYDGYSKDHMKGGHYVCRGGSWATAAPILRCTFRNWYVPTYRQGFMGLRCASSR